MNIELKDTHDPSEFLNEEVISAIEESTKGMAHANLEVFDGEVVTSAPGLIDGLEAVTRMAGGERITTEVERTLGTHNDISRYALFLTAPDLPDYKFGVMIYENDITGYPVTVSLEDDINEEIGGNRSRLWICNSMESFEALCIKVLNSERLLHVLEGIIQASLRKRKREET